MGDSPVGKTLGISAQGVANALKGMVWGVPIRDVDYDGEFTGELTPSGEIEVMIKRKSDKQTSTQAKKKAKKG
jgi:hypothetical protein